MMRRGGLALSGLLVASACLDPVAGGPDRTVRLGAVEVWSGGEISLYSPGSPHPPNP